MKKEKRKLHFQFLINQVWQVFASKLLHFQRVDMLSSLSGRLFLAGRKPTLSQVRGKALQNWKRPSIDEMAVPSEPWSRVHDRNQKKFSVQLLTGVTLFAVTAMTAINTVATNSTPHNLLKLDVKFDQAE